MQLQIKQARETRGITQSELAAQAGVSQPCVAQWERGATSPKSALLPKLAAILGCTVDELYGVHERPRDGQEGKDDD